jgi:hypothetical protein
MISFMTIQRLLSMALLTLIILVQVVHYPSFKFLDKETFSEAMNFHQRRITWVVLPLMVSELLLSIWIILFHPGFINSAILAIVILIWASTFFLQVPLHQRLLVKKDPAVIDSLVQSNLIRIFLWATKLVMTFIGVLS